MPPLKNINLIFLIFFCLKIQAQTFPTKHYTIRDGIAQMQVMALLEDSRGLLWVGTKGGLSGYDGTSFKNYKRSEGDSLVHDQIIALKEDRQGFIWILTAYGLNRFNGAEFDSWRFPSPDEHGGKLFITQKDEIFVYSDKEFLYQMVNGKLKKIDLLNVPKSLTSYAVYYDYATDKILFCYSNFLSKPTYFIYELNQQTLKLKEKSDEKLMNIYPYGKHGYVHFHKNEPSNKQLYWFQESGQKEKKLILTISGNDVMVHQTLPFNFLFGFQNKLTILEKNTKIFQQLGEQFLEPSTIAVDKTGIWAGSETGLWRVMENGIKYIPESRDAVVWGMVEDKFNRLLTTHYNTTVPIKIHEGTKTSDLTGYQATLSKQIGKPFGNLHYFSPLKDQYQNLWFPSGDGLIRYDYKHFQMIFRNTYAFFLAEDVKRNLIISSVGGGVNIIENTPPYEVTELREKDGLHPNAQMLCVFVDSKGRHWYGGGRGLTRYDYDHKKAFRYPMKSDKVPFNTVFLISEDAWGTLWFGTTKGLFLYSDRTDSFTAVAPNTIKGYINLVGILDKNHVVCADGKSIFILDLMDFHKDKSLNIKVLNYNNGFMGIEPSQAGFFKAHDGKVWISSSDIISILSPKELDLSISATQPMFTKIDTQAVSFVKQPKPIIYQLPHGKSDNVRIEFTSLGFEKSINPAYSYQLDGSDWSEWQAESFIILYNLTSNEHTLNVKTQISGLQKKLVPLQASIKFSTSLYPWQSPNFAWYLLPMALLILGFALFKWFWERRLRRKMETQQQELKFLKVAALQAQMNPHFIFNILEVIKSYILLNQPRVAANMVTKLGELVRNYLESTLLDI